MHVVVSVCATGFTSVSDSHSDSHAECVLFDDNPSPADAGAARYSVYCVSCQPLPFTSYIEH